MKTENKNAGKNEDLFSMHTVTFRTIAEREEWEDFKEALAEEAARASANIHKYYKQDKKIHYHTTKRWGYMHITMHHNKQHGQDIIDLKVNPRTLLDVRCPFAYIASSEDISQCVKRIGDFLKSVGADDLKMDVFYIKRIDYCVNIRLNGADEVADYMRLMKKGRYPYSSKRVTEYSPTQKRWIETKDSFTVGSGTFEFSVYNKYRQLANETRNYHEDDLRAAEGMVRIEYRANRGKVLREIKKHGCGDLQAYLDLTAQIAEENIPRILRMCYGCGRFVKYDEAIARIEASGMKRKTKEKMKGMLCSVSKHSLQYEKEYNPDYEKLMSRFNKLGISPVTLQHRSEFASFENPATYIRTNNANQNRESL